MTGGRVFLLVVGLWAFSAFGQAIPVNACQSTALTDAGAIPARAYWVVGNSAMYAMATAGAGIQVFDSSGVEIPVLEPSPNGPFNSFAVANGVQIGAATFTTLVAAADVSAPCSASMCLRIFFWDPTRGFQLQSTAPTAVLNATAMAIDAPGSAINIYYATSAIGGPSIWQQTINVNATNGAVSLGAFNSRSLPGPGTVVEGITVDGVDTPNALYVTDNASNLYTLPTDVTNTDGGIFAQPNGGGYGFIEGVFFAPNPNTSPPYVLLAGGVSDGLYLLNPYNSLAIVEQQYVVHAADGGAAFPTAASSNPNTPVLLVTEDQNNITGGAWLHLLQLDGGCRSSSDGGTSDGGATDGGGADAGGIPTIPIIAPGPGALPGTTNSCNCSTAGSAPVLLALLLPLLVPRRRR